MTSQFEHLFTPIEVGPLKLRNRIYVTPHATGFASDDQDNLPGERLAHYCAERAKGGVALIEVSMGVVSAGASSLLSMDKESHFDPLNPGYPLLLTGRWPLRANDPKIVPGYSRLAKAVHEYGAKCSIEISSGGSNRGSLYGVSSFPWPAITGTTPLLPFTSRELDETMIEESIESYGIAAKHVKESGLDGVNIQSTHGSLISEFLSTVMNRRKDRYGGSLENRMRFQLQVLQRVRESVSNEIAIGMSLTGDEGFRNGYTPEDAAEIVRLLDGKVDWITADMGVSPQQSAWQAVPMYVGSGYNIRITSPVKKAAKITKIGSVGRYVDPIFAEHLLAEGEADIVAMTRALIADPELPNKAREGRLDEIRPCIGVMQDCWGRMARGLPLSCTVNPAVSREKEWGIGSIKKSEIKKKILIIGGGPAGLEAARIAAERGHRVTIYEKSQSLGGQVLLAAKLPARSDMKAIINWQIDQVKKLGVEIKFGLEVTSDESIIKFVIDEEKPDAIIVATGSVPIRTGFQPYDFNEVEGWNSTNVCTEVDVLEGRVQLGHNVVIADTLSFIEAPGLAEHLARQGKDVQIITYHNSIALESRVINHWEHLLPRLSEAGVRIIPFTWIRKIQGRTLVVYDVYSYKERAIHDIDNVVLITGKIQNDSIYFALNGRVNELFLIGDANIGGARIGFAMYEGQKVGRLI